MGEVAGILTALAGLIGAVVAAYQLVVKPAPTAQEEDVDEEPKRHEAQRQEDAHKYDHVSDVHDPGDLAVINELRSALAESRHTVHALRKRLDLAMGIDTSEEPPRQIEPPPPQDWLGGG